MTLSEKVEDRIAYEPNSGCWIWLGYVNPDGYAMVHQTMLHRPMYEERFGPIPNGLVLDHKCRIRCCINPDHLEPVTNAENVLRGIGWTARNARKTHCKHGHKLTPENVIARIRDGRPRRYCRECQRRMDTAYKARSRKKLADLERALSQTSKPEGETR